jgi:RES domain-containing protein
MQVFRISLEKWTHNLKASGNKGRWSRQGSFVLYTASTRALACLENVVHRSDEGLQQLFKVMVIDIPDEIEIEEIDLDDLEKGWNKYNPDSYEICQEVGERWLSEKKCAVLRVPSSIILREHNYLINVQHPDFLKIKLTDTEDFEFDLRIKTVN